MTFQTTIYLPPGEIRLNRRKTKDGRLNTHWRQARQALIRDLIEAYDGREPFRGDVYVCVEQFWPQDGDIDAIAKGLFDALQKARIIGDDDQIVETHQVKHRNSRSPRLVIEVGSL